MDLFQLFIYHIESLTRTIRDVEIFVKSFFRKISSTFGSLCLLFLFIILEWKESFDRDLSDRNFVNREMTNILLMKSSLDRPNQE